MALRSHLSTQLRLEMGEGWRGQMARAGCPLAWRRPALVPSLTPTDSRERDPCAPSGASERSGGPRTGTHDPRTRHRATPSGSAQGCAQYGCMRPARCDLRPRHRPRPTTTRPAPPTRRRRSTPRAETRRQPHTRRGSGGFVAGGFIYMYIYDILSVYRTVQNAAAAVGKFLCVAGANKCLLVLPVYNTVAERGRRASPARAPICVPSLVRVEP
jgi:hypothetical protein